MSYYPVILIDTGLVVAYYSADDQYHIQSQAFFEHCTSQLVTTVACATESMQLLAANFQVQNEFLRALSLSVFECEHLQLPDFTRIAELNAKYADLPGDFADLALIAISERLEIEAIATLNSDFDVYRRYRKQPFERVFRPQ